mgnify:CR=1 FL=1
MSTEQDNKSAVDDDIGSLRQSLNTFVLPIEKKQQVDLCSHLDSEMLNLSELTGKLLRVPAAALQICRVAGEAARRRDIDILTLEHEVSLASLLFLSPCWVLVYQRPEVFAEWEARHLGHRTAGTAFRRWLMDSDHVLGLAQQLAEDWWLPPWILQGYRSLGSSRRTIVRALHIARDTQHPREQQAALDADRNLYRWLTLPANSLLMANGLALGAHHDWDARHTRRWLHRTSPPARTPRAVSRSGARTAWPWRTTPSDSPA